MKRYDQHPVCGTNLALIGPIRARIGLGRPSHHRPFIAGDPHFIKGVMGIVSDHGRN
jgi:hypothetical protein